MATHKSAAKRARQALRINATNRKTRSKVRTMEQKMRAILTKKDKKAAEELLNSFMSTLGKAAQKGVIHTRNAGRRIARVSAEIAGLK